MKATHYGECQVCGHRQKLPNGKLSNHGYSVRAGFFEGTCRGAKKLPFELDKSLIDGSIEMANAQLQNLKSQISAQRDGTGPLFCRIYDRHARHSLLANRIVEVLEIAENGKYSYIHPSTKQLTEGHNLGYNRERAIEYLRKERIFHLESSAKQIEQYIGWQQQRIKDWSPKPLQPIGE